jgi:hypothetical protein
MKDRRRLAQYLRRIAGDIAEARGDIVGCAHTETIATLDAVMTRLCDVADEVEAADD